MPDVLSRSERHAVLTRLRHRWPSTERNWWYPIDACGGPHVLLLETAWFEHEADLNRLRQQLGSINDDFVWQLAEGTPHWDDDPPDGPIGQDYRYAITEAPLAVGASEAIWVPTSLAWFVYTGHDQNSYFVGNDLLQAVKVAWPCILITASAASRSERCGT